MAIERIDKKLKEWISAEWELAGHKLSGAFEQSLEVIHTKTSEGIRVDVLGNEYGIYMSKGVTADRIPYTPRPRGTGKGGTSKYIQGLVRYVKARMGIADEREALSVAFAIAYKHKQEGMPIKNGKLGSGFLEIVRKKHIAELEALVAEEFELIIEKSWQ